MQGFPGPCDQPVWSAEMASVPVSVEPRFRGGEGSPLVLLHAGFTSWRLWEPLLPQPETSVSQ